MPLSDSHLAVPKAFSIGVCFSLFPVLTCSHFHKSRQIKSPFKANYVESLKLFLGHFSICAVSFLGSLLDLCVQHRFKIMNAKQNRAPFTRKMHTSWAKIIGKVTCSRLWLQRSSTVHALVEIITKLQAKRSHLAAQAMSRKHVAILVLNNLLNIKVMFIGKQPILHTFSLEPKNEVDRSIICTSLT